MKGVLELFHRDSLELAPEEESFLEMIAGQAAIAYQNAALFEERLWDSFVQLCYPGSAAVSETTVIGLIRMTSAVNWQNAPER